jgi:hypothetical protein
VKKKQNWILAVDFLHKKCQFEPRYTDGHGCTIWEYRGGGGIHPVDATAVAYLYSQTLKQFDKNTVLYDKFNVIVEMVVMRPSENTLRQLKTRTIPKAN